MAASRGEASWIDEEGQIPESDDSFGQVSIGAYKNRYRPLWQCNEKQKRGGDHHAPHLSEGQIETAFAAVIIIAGFVLTHGRSLLSRKFA